MKCTQLKIYYLQSGQLVQYGTGIYAYGNIPLLLKRKIETIIQEVLNKYGCIEISLPTFTTRCNLENSGRWDKYVDEGTMLTITSDKGDFFA